MTPDPPPRRAVTTRPRAGPGLAFLGAAASLSAFLVASAALSTTTLRDPSWWVVIAWALAFLALWGATLASFFAAVASDYDTRARVIPGLAQSPAPWPLRRARWPSFTLGLALFVATTAAAPGGLGPVALLARTAATALLAAVVASWGNPRGLWIEGDVVRVEGWLTRKAVRLDAIAQVVAAPGGGLTLRLRDGRSLRVPTSGACAEQTGALVRAIALAADVELAPDAPSEGSLARWAALDRNGRSLTAWRDDLRRLARGDEGFRASPVTRDDLLRLLADPATPAERRLAAALALWDTREDALETEARIREAARDAPVTQVRAALLDVTRDRLQERDVTQALEAEQRRAR